MTRRFSSILFSRFSLSPFLSVILIFLLLASCGKKGPPTLRAYEMPDVPSDLRAIHREDRIILFWKYKKNENIKEFHIFRSRNTDFREIASVDKDVNSYSDTDFKTDILYKYKVVASSPKGILSNDSNIATVIPISVPPAPKNILFRVGNDALHISWEAAEGILYNIYKSSEKGRYGINPLNSEPSKTSFYRDVLELNKSVYYVVRGVFDNESKNEGPASDEIEVNPVNFVPSNPRGLEKVLMEDKVVLLWKENPEAWVMKYRIYQKITDKEEFKLIGESVTPVFTIMDKTGAKHFYKVTAVGPSRESEYSEAVEIDF